MFGANSPPVRKGKVDPEGSQPSGQETRCLDASSCLLVRSPNTLKQTAANTLQIPHGSGVPNDRSADSVITTVPPESPGVYAPLDRDFSSGYPSKRTNPLTHALLPTAEEDAECPGGEGELCACHAHRHVDADGKLRWWGTIEEVPDYQQVPFILSHYRLNTRGFLHCLGSVFWLHNETLNIWTHLLGLLYFAHMTYTWWHKHTHTTTTTLFSFDTFMVLLLCFASSYCMFASSFFHAMCCDVKDRHRCCLSFDLSGVSVLTGASFFSGIYFAFYCHEKLQMAYSLLTVCVVLTLTLMPRFKFFLDPAHWKWRIAAYVLVGGSGAIPLMHFLFVCTHTQLALLTHALIWMPICYLGGASIFVLRIPERWYPGAFDLIGMSHNFWHMCVFFAAYVWLDGVMRVYDYVHTGNNYCAV